MPDAEWILTFDDGPLPSDVVSTEGLSEDELLAPLEAILKALNEHEDGPIPAVFYLRGPAYPWTTPPPKSVFERGIEFILNDGHRVALHCFRHDPNLWWGWLTRSAKIKEDLDRGLEYFEPITGKLTAFRPPYGQGGIPAFDWAREHNIRHHLMDVDTKDWRHHPDALFRRWVDDPGGHLFHILNSLPSEMWFHTLWPGANDVLLHVSVRTAGFLPQIIDRISKSTRDLFHEPKYVVPDEYMVV